MTSTIESTVHERAASRDAVLQVVIPHARGKKVLDIGCVEHSTENINQGRVWVHEELRKASSHLTGIDILDEDISVLKQRGFNVQVQSAETFGFDETFEVIFAGELIEHLSNAGLFLDQCSKHLSRDGTLILTTPNAYNIYEIGKVVAHWSNDPYANPEHTCWYSPTVIRTLLGRHGFRVIEMHFVDYPYIKPRLKHRLASMLSALFGRKFKTTMIVVAKHS